MSEFSDLLESIVDKKTGEIVQGMIAKIATFDKLKMRASIQPMLQNVNDVDVPEIYPIIQNVPVQLIKAGTFFIRPEYIPGDLVWVTFSSYDISDSLNDLSLPESEDTNNLSYASVICGVASDNFVPPAAMFAESGTVMGIGTAYIVFSATKIEIKIAGTTVIEFSATGIKSTIPAGFVTSNFHIHPTGVGPSGAPVPGT